MEEDLMQSKFTPEVIERITERVRFGLLSLKEEGVFEQSEHSIARTYILRNRCMNRVIRDGTHRLQYDEEKAKPIIEMARQGDPDARAALTKLLEEFVHRQRPLPPILGAHVVAVYSGDIPPKRKWPRRYRNRDEWVGPIIDELITLGFPPYARRGRKNKASPSACMIVVEAFRRIGIHMELSVVESIWRKRNCSGRVEAVRAEP